MLFVCVLETLQRLADEGDLTPNSHSDVNQNQVFKEEQIQIRLEEATHAKSF